MTLITLKKKKSEIKRPSSCTCGCQMDSGENLSAEIEYITDMAKVMEYGVMSMPALVVDEKVISMGKLLKASEITKLLGKLN